jgi:hypothetical protein
MVGNGSVGYLGYKRLRTASSIPSVHMHPLHQPSRHVDMCSPRFLPILQDPQGRHLSKPSCSPVLVIVNCGSLTTLRPPFLTVSPPAQPCGQGLIRFTHRQTRRTTKKTLIIGILATRCSALTSDRTASRASMRMEWAIRQKRTLSSHSCVRMVCPYLFYISYFVLFFLISARRTYAHRHIED